MKRFHHAIRVSRAAAAAALCAHAVLCAHAAHAQNYVELLLSRADNPGEPGTAFTVEVDIVVADVAGVSDVSLTAGAIAPDVRQEEPGLWNAETEFASLADLRAAVDGTWTITLSGSTPSTSTFTLTASTLVDGDFFASPAVTSPSHGATGVALDPTFAWTDPTGPATPYALGVEAEREGSASIFQDDLSAPFGSLAIDDTSWMPPLLLDPGQNVFFVFYADVDSGRVTALDVGSGSITWSNSPFAPAGPPFGPWPASTPLLVLESFTEIQFTTERLVDDFESYALQTDTTGSGGSFFVTTTGDPADPAVAEVGESLAGSTGIADDGASQVWVLGSQSGSTGVVDGAEGFLLVGDIPAFTAPTAGVFSEFFAVPRDLGDSRLRARVREAGSFTDATQFRFLMVDATDNEAASPLRHLATNLTVFESPSTDFADFPSNPTPFDFSQVRSVGLEMFSDPAVPSSVPSLLFHVDDLEIVPVPEPAAGALACAALGAVGVLGVARRRAR